MTAVSADADPSDSSLLRKAYWRSGSAGGVLLAILEHVGAVEVRRDENV